MAEDTFQERHEKVWVKNGSIAENNIVDCWADGHHQRYLVDRITGKKVCNVYEAYCISPKESRCRKSCRAVFLDSVSDLFGMVFTHADSGCKARFSKNTANKIASDKAITKSVVNGFSVEKHFEAAGTIKSVFEQAAYAGMYSDRKHDPNIIAVHRFQKDMTLSDGEKCFAFITVKEVKKDGMRIYTLELLKKKCPLQTQGNEEPRLLQA